MINRKKSSGLIITAALALASCSDGAIKEENQETMVNNILLEEWSGPYGGVPAFDQMKVEDLKEAILKGMEMKMAEIEAIANNAEPATFENTIVAMERSGAPLDRAFTYYGIFSANGSTPEFREIEGELVPKISEHSSAIIQNEKLFQRIKTVYEAAKTNPLPADQQRVVELMVMGNYDHVSLVGKCIDDSYRSISTVAYRCPIIRCKVTFWHSGGVVCPDNACRQFLQQTNGSFTDVPGTEHGYL